MGRIGGKLDIDFVVSTGDNFYDNGLTGEEDSAFEESFSRIYTAKSLQKQWYSGKYPTLMIRWIKENHNLLFNYLQSIEQLFNLI
jgi:hypothetical protein